MRLKVEVKIGAKWIPVRSIEMNKKGRIVKIVTVRVGEDFPLWWTLEGNDLERTAVRIAVDNHDWR